MTNFIKLSIFRAAAVVTLFTPFLISSHFTPSLAMGFIYLPMITLILATGLMMLDSQLKQHLVANTRNRKPAKRLLKRSGNRLLPIQKPTTHFSCKWLGINCSA